MNTTSLILIGVAAVAILGAVGAFAVAFRKTRDTSDWTEGVKAETRAADKSMKGVRVAPLELPETDTSVDAVEETSAVAVATEPEADEGEPVSVSVVEAQRVVEVSPEEAGVTRRQFFNRALGATFGLWGAGLGLGFLSYFWPRVTGGFGASIVAGTVPDIESQIHASDGSIVPLFVPEARAYVVPAPQQISVQFSEVKVAEGGLMALYQRCVHLGCRVPWCSTSQGFECPCHGSKYNSVGEYFDGPAPRNLDRFIVEVSPTNDFIIHTGDIIETPRAPIPSVEYPQGPSCIG